MFNMQCICIIIFFMKRCIYADLIALIHHWIDMFAYDAM